MFRTREEIEQFEAAWLAPYACHSARSRGRDFPSEPHPYRTEFQKDRDRIIHTTAYRRLQYKTQVFVYYEGDYYRTRLTHTNEAAQIGRTMARALRVNEDLTEAITLAHDLGHAPFGHAGEEALDRLMRERLVRAGQPANPGHGFNHTVQTLRLVERLEKRWPGFEGLNLTWETREGIAKHATEYDSVSQEFARRFAPGQRGSLEAQLVNFADELTYTAHDLDDGLRSELLSPDMPELQRLDLWQRIRAEIEDPWSELTRHRLIRALIDLLVTDLIRTSAANLDAAQPQSPDDVRRQSANLVDVSPTMQAEVRELKDFLYQYMYYHWRVVRMKIKAERAIAALFEAFEADPRQLPPETRLRVEQVLATEGTAPFPVRASRAICDYIAGMTDRFALQEYERMFSPFERA
jgi:dGTPase